MGELFLSLVSLVERGGKPTALGAIILGLALIPAGLWLTFELPGDGYIWPIMLSVSALGIAVGAMGVAALRNHKRLAGFDEDVAPANAQNVEAVDQMALPFWVCGDCKIVVSGVAVADRCTQCGSPTSFVAVEREQDRSLARSMLS